MTSGLVVSVLGAGSAYRSGGYTGEFWALPLAEKLTHIHTHRRPWWWLSLGSILGLIVMTAGITGFAYLLTTAGAGPLAWSSYGLYLVAVIAWTIGLIAQTATLPIAATEQAETGTTPSWIHSFWAAGYLAEAIWVIVANLSYAVLGLALLQSGLLADWAGWVSLSVGVVIPIVVVVTRFGFPELAQVVPFILGIALILSS